MLKDVTLGQYYSVDSVVHRLDPRFKIRFTIAYILLLLLDRNLPLFSILSVVFLVSAYLSKVPFSHMLKGLKSIFIFILICSALNIFTTPGHAIVNLGGIEITEEGLIKFGFIFWRMVLMILMSSIIMYTTTPTELTDGLEKCFHLSGSAAMGITIALRFVSVLFEELQRIMRAQEARGANFHKGGPIRRLKALSTVIIPLFRNSIDRASNLADAMDARCYEGGKDRTKLNPLTYEFRDFIGYVLLLGVIALSVWMIIKF